MSGKKYAPSTTATGASTTQSTHGTSGSDTQSLYGNQHVQTQLTQNASSGVINLPEVVIRGENQGVVTLPGVVIEGSVEEARKEAHAAGLREMSFQFIANDFNGVPMTAHSLFASVTDSDGNTSQGMGGGLTSLPKDWLRPGAVTVDARAVPTGGAAQAGGMVSGRAFVTAKEGANPVTLTQNHTTKTVQASSEQQAKATIEKEIGGAVEVKIVKIEGKATTGSEKTRTEGQSVTYTARVGLPSFAVKGG